MNEVVEHAVQLPAIVESETQALISAIERAASNPRINVDKMRQLLDMQKDIMVQRKEEMREQKAELFNSAMSDCQAEMRPIAANAENPQTRSMYADYAQLDRHLRPIYTKHGYSLSFDEADSPKPDHVRVLCYVAHRGGHCRTYRRDMPVDGKGAKGGDVMTKTHAIGSAFTYGQRYLLRGIFNVAVGVDDNDGNGDEGAGEVGEDDTQRVKAGYISNKEIADLEAMITEVKANKQVFLEWMQVKRLADIPKIHLKTAVRGLEAKRRQS